MPADSALAALGDESFVSLTTFRRSGERVSTPVWVARDGDALVVTTPDASGKVKRLRNDSRVELQACGRTGKVKPGSAVLAGSAEIIADDAGVARLTRSIRSKYKLEYYLITGIERFIAKAGTKRRVILRITD